MNEGLVPSLVKFMRSLAVLGLPAESQVQWLNSLGLPGNAYEADELAHEFGDGVLLVRQLVDHGWISEIAADKIQELDDFLGEMSGPEHAEIWKVSALGQASEWAKVRDMAVNILLLL
ncbi:hypothetical protein [Actinophytocola algeriensis]|uniref:Uncharacterized protein n=1 Tax=Actinophytocola algeriensis TaxID=1768010 RepID=A0A7W7Q121_9PSEU|nr:hypothetical protein [Actinophytocola algeriensis]MBB4905042.1 hypothetical protein [Actinophytocola algeriensis]MBE1476098.1 hypothetical protein [Actinophytocola algeriensis]